MNLNQYWSVLRTPLLALVLGLAPFWIFAGASNSVTVNGEVVSESSFNLAGLVLGIVGVVVAFRALRGGGAWYRLLLSGVALVVCLFQIAWSSELITRNQLNSVFGWPLPVQPEYASLDMSVLNNLRLAAHQDSEAALRQDVIDTFGLMLARFSSHKRYADACHKGELWVEEWTLQPPDFIDPADAGKIAEKQAEVLADWPARACSATNSDTLMKGLAESIHQDRAALSVILPAYRWRLVPAGHPDAASSPLETDPILAAAEAGDPEAQGYLAGYYFNGRIVPQDDAEAAHWYRKVVEHGAPSGISGRFGEAAFHLGLLLMEDGRGVAQNDAEAALWYAEAEKHLHMDAAARLAVMYYEGRGVDKDPRRAGELFLKAAKHGNATIANWFEEPAQAGNADAQNALGTIYADPQSGVRDDTQAAEWFRRAAEQGHDEAQFSLAMMYDIGRGVDQDASEAAAWMRKSAEHGYADAQVELGVMYYRGTGVLLDYEQAAAWNRKAAAQDHMQAAYNLGIQYANGHGVPLDLDLAADWMRKADALGHTTAAEALKEIEVLKAETDGAS